MNDVLVTGLSVVIPVGQCFGSLFGDIDVFKGAKVDLNFQIPLVVVNHITSERPNFGGDLRPSIGASRKSIEYSVACFFVDKQDCRMVIPTGRFKIPLLHDIAATVQEF